MRRHRDSGVATVWAAVVITALSALLAAVVGVGAAVAARHRAAAAADLAAIAGAARAWSGPEAACAEAGDVAERMGVELRACHAAGLEITVRVGRAVAGFGWAGAVARAGPLGAASSVRPNRRPPGPPPPTRSSGPSGWCRTVSGRGVSGLRGVRAVDLLWVEDCRRWSRRPHRREESRVVG